MTPEQYGILISTAWTGLKKAGWHWFGNHFTNGPSPFADSILHACGSIDDRAPNIGTTLLQELCSIGGREGDEQHYEQLLQKLSEILIIERIVYCPWPQGATFKHEPAAFPKGPRPELMVTYGDLRLVVEVKTPALLDHIRKRGGNSAQLAYRGGMKPEFLESITKGAITLPRDNPVSDFLNDAERKFSGFRDGSTTTLLVIVWDDHIYEPISSLVNQASGLLTESSFSRAKDAGPVRFPSVDAIIVIRHMNYFLAGSREENLSDRFTAMDFGEDDALPNVLFQAHGGRELPAHVIKQLRAVRHDSPGLKTFAEYNPQDVIFWL